VGKIKRNKKLRSTN